MLLLAGLVVAFHIGREERAGEVLSNRQGDSDKENGGTRMIPLTHGLILAAILFVLGLTGLVIRRNLLFMLISRNHDQRRGAGFRGGRQLLGSDRRSDNVYPRHQPRGREASIGLALLLQLHRRRQNLNIDSVSELRG